MEPSPSSSLKTNPNQTKPICFFWPPVEGKPALSCATSREGPPKPFALRLPQAGIDAKSCDPVIF